MVVERTFRFIFLRAPFSKDYERLPESHQAFVEMAGDSTFAQEIGEK